jgi:hypothetical protein
LYSYLLATTGLYTDAAIRHRRGGGRLAEGS